MRRLLLLLCASCGDDPVHHLGDAPPANPTLTLTVRGTTYSGTGVIGTGGCSSFPNCMQIGANPISVGGPAIIVDFMDSTTPATSTCFRGLLLFSDAASDSYNLVTTGCSVTLSQASANPGSPYVGTFTTTFSCTNGSMCTPATESATGTFDLLRP